MSDIEIRQQLHKYVDELDTPFLTAMYAMTVAYTGKNEIAGYTTKGEPLTREKIIKRARNASARVKAGQYLTQEEVEKQSENW